MFFILSKLLTVLIMPMSIIVIVFISSFIIKKRKKQLQILAVALFFFFSNPFISQLAMRWWEVAPIAINSIQKPYEVGVVLCGVTNPHQKPDDRAHFNTGADRIIHAVQLYKLGKIKKFSFLEDQVHYYILMRVKAKTYMIFVWLQGCAKKTFS